MLTRDALIIMAARGLRMLVSGYLSVILGLYLSARGFSIAEIGLVFTVALAGGAAITTGATLYADRWGRRTLLIAFSLVMAAAGTILAADAGLPLLLLAAVTGTFSPGGQDIGLAQPLEQAALSEASPDPGHAMPYAWYNLVGYLAIAAGALVAGAAPGILRTVGWTALDAQRFLVWTFAAAGALLAVLYAMLSPAIEAFRSRSPRDRHRGLTRSRTIVLRLAALFGVDSLAGGLVVQSLLALWFNQRFGIGLDRLGPLFFGTNLLSALSALAAARIADRFGLLNVMVFTHLPSNVLLILVPFMPSWPLAALVLLARHALAQMDVPTRQAYTMIVVAPEERAAAAGLTNAVRPAASSLAPVISGLALQMAASALPFVLCGGLKIAYDVALWMLFRKVPLDRAAGSISAAQAGPAGGTAGALAGEAPPAGDLGGSAPDGRV